MERRSVIGSDKGISFELVVCVGQVFQPIQSLYTLFNGRLMSRGLNGPGSSLQTLEGPGGRLLNRDVACELTARWAFNPLTRCTSSRAFDPGWVNVRPVGPRKPSAFTYKSDVHTSRTGWKTCPTPATRAKPPFSVPSFHEWHISVLLCQNRFLSGRRKGSSRRANRGPN